ncbi:hypothetical protein [Oceanirhabdus sp. W0125-5]|uniref:hypothetical protein n=1 Tax=Oceanirhabdus sp. W0125-5 TaxID=2999116 RepID=UPI0022F2B404|nr:hypothetical protein [Oceanirhabdus sp. W0125-5]WBW96083.1 hypothetical protein OW730_20665 [Oceanirhabdus sp. W0125-5]
MDAERKIIKLLINEVNIINEELILYEEAPDDEEMVLLEITVDGHKISFISDDFFTALTALRRELKKKNIKIICNGAVKNVYPSAMQSSMSYGRKAYKLFLGKQAKLADVVDIFEYEEGLEITDVDEQSKFFDDWINSLKG